MQRPISFTIPQEESFTDSNFIEDDRQYHDQQRYGSPGSFSGSIGMATPYFSSTTMNLLPSRTTPLLTTNNNNNNSNTDNRNNNNNNHTTAAAEARGASLRYEQQVLQRAMERAKNQTEFDHEYDYDREEGLLENNNNNSSKKPGTIHHQNNNNNNSFDPANSNTRRLHNMKNNTTVLDERVDQALEKPTIIKLFLGGTGATALPTNLNKLRGRVREVLCDNSPRMRHLSPDIATLSSTLVRLDCSHSALESLPEELGNLRCLQYLNLSDNNLTRFVWNCKSLTKLVELDLSFNKIRYFSPQVADLIFARAASAPKERSAVVDPRNKIIDENSGDSSSSDNTNTNNNQQQSQLARLGLRKIFIDLTGNTEHFVKVANRGERLNHLIPDEASCTCSICQKPSYISMPFVSARFMHLGEGPVNNGVSSGISSSNDGTNNNSNHSQYTSGNAATSTSNYGLSEYEKQQQMKELMIKKKNTNNLYTVSSSSYLDQKMTGTTPKFNFVPILYPTCSAECTLALQRWQEWLKTVSIVDR